MKFVGALLLMLSIASITPLKCEELSGEMLAVPDEILIMGAAGFLGPGDYTIPVPLLAFTVDGWIAMSQYLRGEHER